MKKLALLLLGLFTGLCLHSAVTVDMVPKTGLAINTEFCELSLASRIVVVQPPWSNSYFSSGIAKLDFEREGKRFVRMIQLNKTAFELLNFSAEVEDGNSVLIDLSGILVKDVSAIMEFSCLVIPDYVLANSDFSGVDMEGKPFSGHIDTAGSGEMPIFGNNFKEMSVNSPIGTYKIEVLEGPGLSMVDRRVNTFMGYACFWVGFHQGKLTTESPLKSRVRVTFIASGDVKIAQPLPEAGGAEAVAVEKVELPATAPQIPLFPAPHKRVDLPGEFSLAKPVRGVFTLPEFSAEDNGRLERAARRYLADAGKLELTDAGTPSIVAVYDENIPDQGFDLNVSPEKIEIKSSSPRGVFYAIQSLALLADTAKGVIPCLEISDYPDMPVRGVHVCLDAGDRTYFDLVEKVWSPARINMIIGEVEYVKWDATKALGIHREAGMSKEELAEFVALCRENFIDFVPLMQTLGHCGWLFVDGKNRDMAEDVNTPYAYNVSNPEVYPLMTRILDEIFAICEPEFLHIGHDEVTMIGRFPCREENVKKGIKAIVYDDIMFYHDYASRHGARIMLWHDMLMAPGESLLAFGGAPNFVSEIRKDLPRDIVFNVWRYDGNKFPEFELLKNEGFDVIGASWFGKNNPEQLAVAVKSAGTWGNIVTTWAGYFGSRTLLPENFYQVEPYVRGGSWYWNSDKAANAGYDYSRILCDLLWSEPADDPDAVVSGYAIDFSGQANLQLNADFAPFMLCSNMDMDKLPREGYFGGIYFLLPERNGVNGAIGFKSRLNPEFPSEPVKLEFAPVECRNLYILHTTAGLTPPAKTVLGNLKINYAEGESVSVPLRYGIELGAPTDGYNYFLRPQASYSYLYDGAVMRIWRTGIVNPHPDKAVTGLEISGNDAGFGYYVLGMTLAE